MIVTFIFSNTVRTADDFQECEVQSIPNKGDCISFMDELRVGDVEYEVQKVERHYGKVTEIINIYLIKKV